MRADIERFAERVGSDAFLIQAAGGNISWKDDGTLWVKSSGAWLANARSEDMFVPLELEKIRGLIATGLENYGDFRQANSSLRPSIETALHALMPQRVVVHLHAIDAIAHAVRIDARDRLALLLDGFEWMWVPYHKPGAILASTIAAGIQARTRTPDILVLENHGIVFCADDVVAIKALSDAVLERLRIDPRPLADPAQDVSAAGIAGYLRVDGPHGRSLAHDPISFALARKRWVVYPDHAVFLGPEARIFDSLEEACTSVAAERVEDGRRRPCVIVEKIGVWMPDSTSASALAMLDCYGAVCLRLPGTDAVKSLSDAEIAQLLDWEAEKYRQALALKTKKTICPLC